jgi:hypothetical protein
MKMKIFLFIGLPTDELLSEKIVQCISNHGYVPAKLQVDETVQSNPLDIKMNIFCLQGPENHARS